jgi:hypothetical protein
MKLTKKYFLIAFISIVLVWGIVWLADRWHNIYALQPVWLHHALMTMIDPVLPVSVQLRDSTVRKRDLSKICPAD